MSVIEDKFEGMMSELDELRSIIFGDLESYNKMKAHQEILAADPTVKFHLSEFDMTRKEAFEKSIARTVRIKELIKERGIDDICYTNHFIYGYAGNQMVSTSLHHGMFEPMIRLLGSQSQVKEYLDDLINYRILGCYAQTEIGHGSDVQSLMTEAVLDQTTDEFVVNTPDIKAAKFWPGELGKMATHAVFHAKLIINGDAYGVHAFIAQIRDEHTHRPLKGLEIGDIGPKFGYFAKDNGYMIFKNFRIPRKALLSRFISCSKEGVLSIHGDPKVAYSTMMLIRVTLLNLGWDLLLKSLIISVKYTTFRSQFQTMPNSSEERKIIDYQATRHKIAPYLAFGYANMFVGKRLIGMIRKMEEEIKQDVFHTMKELHALGSALKAHYMQETLDGFYSAREVCGAHGYSVYSNFPLIIELWSPNVTLEGDAMVMYQQTGKAIFKLLKKVYRGDKIFGTFAYLSEIEDPKLDIKIDDVFKLHTLTDVIKVAALHQIKATNDILRAEDGVEWHVKWNKTHQLEVVKSVKLHSIYTTACIFAEELRTVSISSSLREKLTSLCKIYCCDQIFKHCDGVLLNGYISGCHLLKIRDMYDELVDNVTPHMKLLTQASSPSDETLHSLIGRKLSKSYDRLFDAAANSRLNREQSLSAIHEDLKPLANRLKMAAKI